MSYITGNSQPVLQIIHVSDMHVVATHNPPAAKRARGLRRFAAKLGPLFRPLVDKLDDGLAAYDPFAPFFFSEFVDKVAKQDAIWSTRPTWIIDTGDQTTFGDDASLSDARSHLTAFAAACAPPVDSLVNVCGNHDAWPEDLPAGGASQIPTHRAKLQNAPYGFAVGRAQACLRTSALPNGDEVQLFTIDTVDDDFWPNTWALGRVDDPQLDQLARDIQNWGGNGRHLRVLATHHPVHFPPPRPNFTMSIVNDDHVGARLAGSIPFVQIVLSGHTHALYPKHGHLPAAAAQCPHPHLGAEQCQLVVGTLMQEDVLQKRGDHPHQCQVLRVWHDPKDSFVVIERHLAARNPYAAQPRLEYDFVALPGTTATAEELRVSL